QEFGDAIATLLEGVLRMAAINETDTSKTRVLGQNQDQVENVRKMLLAMVDDVRVALIKLAERTCAIRAVKTAGDEKRRRVAREVFDIYAPLAHRLGIGQLKWELEDL
ncbi:MAG TPA: GTP diphosphokinase, partial [Pseudohongiella sp.]|nr:GTP diphosphokinase [Pseudohongiella sp.]